MSSMHRGATGANRPKPVNVNNLYSGRNLAAGTKPAGKHGMQSVGKSVGVVRRMPPPATLPSLRAENNGQDPTTVIVPQTGSGGWLKTDVVAPVEPTKPSVGASSNGPDLRPTWAKPQAVEPVAVPTSTSSNREFPTLAISSQGKDIKEQNAWNTGSLQRDLRSSVTSSVSIDDDRQLPSRYYDSGPKFGPGGERNYRSRFQGSNDARASQPSFTQRFDGNSERIRGDSVSESIISVKSDQESKSYTTADRRNTADSMESADGKARSDSARLSPREVLYEHDPDIEENGRQQAQRYPATPTVDAGQRDSNQRSQHDRNNHTSSQNGNGGRYQQEKKWQNPQVNVPAQNPQPEYRLLKRPERIELEDISDDDEEIQMTKLNKPAVRVIKRVPFGHEGDVEEPSAPQVKDKSKSLLNNKTDYSSSRQGQDYKRVEKPKRKERDMREDQDVAKPTEQLVTGPEIKVEDVVPAPPPAENIWAKRKEERESQEKENQSRVPRAMQQAIQHHFPDVNETATIKVNKELARRPADAEFQRATMRAQRAPACNDVRQMMPRGDDSRSGGYRDSHDYNVRQPPRDRDQAQRFQRQPREYTDDDDHGPRHPQAVRDYDRDGDYQRPYHREPPRFNQDRDNQNEYDGEADNYTGGSREYSNSRGARRGVAARGRAVRGGRGRIGFSGAQYQIQRKPYVPRDRGLEGDAESSDEPDQADKEMEATTKQAGSASEIDYLASGDSHSNGTPEVKHFNGSGDVARNFESEKSQYPTSRGRYQSRGQALRGRGELRRGGSYVARDVTVQQERLPRRTRVAAEENNDETSLVTSSRGRGSYSQQRTRRGNQRGVRGSVQGRRGSDQQEPAANQERADRLKSPVASSEGQDEYETASESSGRANREHVQRERTPAKRGSQPPRRQLPRDGDEGVAVERIRSKNGQPARRMCRSPSDAGCSSSQKQSTDSRQQPRRNSADKVVETDGLAGVDINNFSSVVVVDEHLQETISPDALHEFEEVMNKKTKKMKAIEEQQRIEAEERKQMKEKERIERNQARKAVAAEKLIKKREARKADVAAARLEPADDERKTGSPHTLKSVGDRSKVSSLHRKDIPVTTVWNSAHVAAIEKEIKEQELSKTPSVIPSPIARPTPRSKSAASETPPVVREEPLRMVELPVSLSSSQPLRGDKYDFTFDATIHEAQVRESQEKAVTSMSTGANSESGSTADDYRLKEKLNRVKDLWSGEVEKDSDPLPSNVAKVKPQPQGGEQGDVEDVKQSHVVTNSAQSLSTSRSPGMAPFPGTGFSGLSPYPGYMMMTDMTSQYGAPNIGGSLLPPPNATSPPTSIPMHGQYAMPQQRSQSRGYMENPMFQRQQNMTWAPNAALDGVMPFGNTPPPPPPLHQQPPSQQQFQFNQGTRGAPPHQQQHRGGFNSHPTIGQQSQKLSVNGSSTMVPFVHHQHHHPMDSLGMNVPPPPPQPHSMSSQQQQPHGAVGSHRVGERSQFASIMGNAYPQAPPPQFSQPPPNMNMRFTQPPPPIGHDVAWNKSMLPPPPLQQQHHFNSGGIYRGPLVHNSMSGSMGRGGGHGQPPADVWSSMQQFAPPPQNNRMHGTIQHKGMRPGTGERHGMDSQGSLKRQQSSGEHHSTGNGAVV